MRFAARLAGALALVLAVAACSARGPDADTSAIRAVSYRDAGPTTVSLITVINNRTGKGAHSALLINASERIIFDPAGSFYHHLTPKRDDVLYGITPALEQGYKSAHARSTFHVVTQTVAVTAAQAEAAYQLAVQNGRVVQAFCASANSNILARVPGLGNFSHTYYPEKLQAQFAQLPGVVTDTLFEDDSSDLQDGLVRANATLTE